jgi:uncharacterized membrane protein
LKKDYVWLIGAVVYVFGMFVLFWEYQTNPLDRFGSLLTSSTLISIFGVLGLLFLQLFIGAWGENKEQF